MGVLELGTIGIIAGICISQDRNLFGTRDGNQVDRFFLRNAVIVKMEKRKNDSAQSFRLKVIYKIKKVCTVEQISAKTLGLSRDAAAETGEKDMTLSVSALNRFLHAYTMWLIDLGIISCSDKYWGLHGYDTKDANLYWREAENVYRDSDSRGLKGPLDNYLPAFQVSGDSILFAVTIFSLLKPLFRICGLNYNVNFVLQIQLESPSEDALWLLELQTHMWCDYHGWPVDGSYQAYAKFRHRYHEQFSPNFHVNAGFPVLLFGFWWPNGRGEEEDDMMTDSYQDDDEDDIWELSPVPGKPGLDKSELSWLCQANCLPILVPFAPPKKKYPRELCLTVTLEMRNPVSGLRWRDVEAWSDRKRPGSFEQDPLGTIRGIHGQINTYYMEFMDRLNHISVSDAKERLKECYRKAVDRLKVPGGRTQTRAGQLAAMLSTLYFVRETLNLAQEKTNRLSTQILEFERAIGVVSIRDFAVFVSECLREHSVVVLSDESGIYLSYKKYWSAFQKYCSEHGIVLAVSAAAFSRNVLVPKGLIVPQYKILLSRKKIGKRMQVW